MNETCESAVELEMLASGMAKQHENYLDALQELIDNSVSAFVKSESYFENPAEPINLFDVCPWGEHHYNLHLG